MQHELNHTVQTLLGRQGLDAVSADELAELTRAYPYASILHFLYSRKLQDTHDPGYAASVTRTALYFSNPHWLHYQLRPASSAEALRAMEDAYAHAHPAQDAPALEPILPAIPDAREMSEVPVPEDAHAAREAELHAGPAKPWQEPEVRTLETGSVTLPHEWDVLEPKTSPTAPAETHPIGTEPGIPVTPALAPPDGLVPLEPLYTIDYFASQGIQLSEEEKQDPLGRKLKSFTEWLKTMKKVHPEKTKVALDSQAEVTIQEGAEHSNHRAEVLTEAMAEVYLKQGLKHKALEVYQKLSLLNPALSANFAAKIADLNATEP
jgi:hypothetical protein